jgi:leucyl aminopeptidase
MRVTASTESPADSGADTIVVGVFEDGEVAHDVDGGALAALIESGEAKLAHRSLALTHAGGARWLLAGLGPEAEFDAERARVSAALAAARAEELSTRHLCWELPHGCGEEVAGALVEGTLLAAHHFERYRKPAEPPPVRIETLTVSAHHDIAAPVERGAIIGAAVNDARVLQDTPGNDMTPGRLAERAVALGEELEGLTVSVERREQITARGMGAFAAVAAGSDQEPALITMRYEGPHASGPTLGYVGKAVTFDSGGISLKPGAGMDEMKFDMSGGAAVIESIAAIARLALPVRLIGVIGATENLPSGRSAKPGDIVRTLAGLHVEINNTDAEGRLVLADCIAYAIEEGAERIVDLATLTGSIIVALGSTYAGLMSNDDEWSAAVEAAGRRSGELVWRMPLHPEYAKIIEGTYADLNNAPASRKAGSITAAEFLHRFAGEVPWAHLDIAGTAWDLDRPYAPKTGSGFGVRLLVELASQLG